MFGKLCMKKLKTTSYIRVNQSEISWLNQRFTFLTMEIRISAMGMVKMGIFVAKFHGKISG